MATYYAVTPTASMTTNAQAQADTIRNVRNAFLSCSFTRMTVSGSVDDLTTLSTGSVSNTLRTFDIFAFNDSLQATHPLYIRVGYRTSLSNPSPPNYTFQMGTAYNSSGSLTGVSTFTEIADDQGPAATVQFNQPVYASGDGSYMTIFIHAATNTAQFAVFERFYDTQGNVTGSGFHMVGVNNTPKQIHSQAAYYGQTPPTRNTVVLPCILPTRANLFYNGSLLLGTVYPFIGKPLNPSPNILLGNSGTFATPAQSVTYTMYGASKSYIVNPANHVTAATSNGMINSDSNLRYLLRYE